MAAFEGSMVAIVTPFRKGKLDEKALQSLVNWQIEEGTDAIIPCGTTGESATLDYDEHYRVIELTVKTAKGRVPIIAGTGANSTDEAIEITKKAMELGADGALLVSPYYNKPTQQGIYLHYKAVAAAVKGFPLILYNVPGRTSSNILPETVARLAEIKNIVGIKEATGDMKQASEVIRLCGKNGFTVLSGDDFTTLPLYALGGKGAISVSANIVPRMQAELWDAWKAGDIEKARKLHFALEPLNKGMFIETNPIPVKTALALMGRIKEEFRLPLCQMAAGNKQKLAGMLKAAKLI
ncbi:MAG: 4-hydroxy-tetrahydrodipicolinate synthase [Nitrospiraceae bacterium]|nr:4-hydroxy-tetrahydrodipicolinate synthase [Nitrospiraceae bacterium]